MADQTSPIQQISAATNAATRLNENFDAASPAMLYGRDAAATSGLTWGYIGGRLGSVPIASGTVSLTASDDNHLVAARTDGAVSVDVATTDWDDAANFIRLYKITTGASAVTDYEDHRQAIGGGGSGSVAWADITGKPVVIAAGADAAAARAAIGAGTSSFSGAYADLSGKPTFGTAAALNVAASGNAAADEVVKGNDTRLSGSGMANPMTTAGDIIIGGTSGAPARLAAGTNTTDALGMAAGAPTWVKRTPLVIPVACSDETTALTAGAAKVTFRMPCAMTLSAVRASLTTAQASGSIFTIDINEGGSSILSTKITIDDTEKTSTTAATAAVISDSALADDAEITIDIDQVGDGTAKGLKVYLIGWPA